MVLKSTPGTHVPVYQISGANSSRSLPDWLAKKRKKALKKDVDYANRIELIQDFEFEEASNRIKLTRDGNFCMATGTYKPQIHVYDFEQLSLKFDRHTDAENVDFVLISDDWTKSVHLQNDRTIEFHAQGGIHARSRIPKFGRSLGYNRNSCDLFVGASGNEIYRLNLDQGRFLAPFSLKSEGVNCIDVSSAHGLVAFGTDAGQVEFWDPRSRTSVGQLGTNNSSFAITSLTFRQNGMNFALGNSDGQTMLFDLRSSQPTLIKDQGYGFSINKLLYLDDALSKPRILTADKRSAKIWDPLDGSAVTSMEPNADINDVAHVYGSGLFFFANEGQPMHTYYIPAIGPAPKWCSFLENLTEEMEESQTSSVYENYRFVTRKELKALNLDHLVGSAVVKSYMHGYFIDMRLYEQAKLISDPYAYREHRDQEIKKRIEKERESRIRSNAASNKVKVNKKLAEEMENIDSRFSQMFEDPEFEVDENSYEYKLLHPTINKRAKEKTELKEAQNERKKLTAAELEEISSQDEDSSSSEDEKPNIHDSGRRSQRAMRLPQEMRPVTAAVGVEKEISFADKIENQQKQDAMESRFTNIIKKGPSGEAEMSYIPPSKGRKKKDGGKSFKTGDHGRSTQRYDGRRRASKNAFRGM